MRMGARAKERYSGAEGLGLSVHLTYCVMIFEDGRHDIVSKEYFEKYFEYTEEPCLRSES